MENIELTAYVLKTERLSDSKWRVTLFTRERGLINVIMRSTKKSKLLLGLNQFIALWFDVLVYSHGYAVRAVELIKNQQIELRNEALFAAWYINELILILMPAEESDPVLYSLYADLINNLKIDPHICGNDTNMKHYLEAFLRKFEWEFLKRLGYALSLANREEINPLKKYQFMPHQGLVISVTGIPGSVYIALENDALLPAEMLPWAKTLTRSMLDFVLDGRVLKTRSLFRSVYSGS